MTVACRLLVAASFLAALAGCSTASPSSVAPDPNGGPKAGPQPTQELHDEIAAQDRAIQVGTHRFYQLLPGKPERLVEVALFTHVWKQEVAGWRLARVLSYGHELAD